MQYRTGTVALTNDSPVVIGTNTAWLANVTPGGMFLRQGDNVPYTVASVVGDTELRLSANYQGISAAAQNYWITTSFTPNRSYPVPEVGDVDSVLVVARAIQQIDADIPAGGAGARFLDDLLDVSTLGVSNGQVLTRLPTGSYGFSDPGVGSVDGANLGTGGANLFSGKVGTTLNFRQIKAVGAQVVQGVNDVTLSVPAPGEVNTGTNLGSVGAIGPFKDKSGTALRFKGFRAGAGISLLEQGDDIVVSSAGGAGGGEANTASNVGVGNVQLFRAKSGADLQFRSLQFDPARFSATLSGDGLSYTLGVQPVTINDLGGAAAQAAATGQVLRKDADGVWRGFTPALGGLSSVQADPAPRLGANLDVNGQRVVGQPGAISGMIETPRPKSYVVCLSTPAPVTIASVLVATRTGGANFSVRANEQVLGAAEDGTGGLRGSAGIGGTPVSLISPVPVAAGSKIEILVSSPSADVADLSFTIDYRTA